MNAPLYALVAYVRNPIGEFVENLRRDMEPGHPDLPAHLTLLPPRRLQGPESKALQLIAEVCRPVAPFEVVMGDVETFAPITPTVFIRVAHAAYRMRELHDKLNLGPLQCDESWPYMPHLTIVKHRDADAALLAAEVSRQRWAQYEGTRRILVDELTFVREGQEVGSWVDLTPIPLGGKLVARTR
jgi:2'-5' RNA ligase